MARSKAPTGAQSSSPLILDSGAVIALAGRNDRLRAFVARAIELGAWVFIPAVVVAETVRGSGPRDAPVNRVITGADLVTPMDEGTARVAGQLLGTARSHATVDALVVATAIRLGGGRIVTSDPDDISALASGHRRVHIHAV